MDLIVDGIIYTLNPYGGIARIFNNVLPLLCDMDPQLRIKMVFNRKPLGQYPQHKNISYFNFYKATRFLWPKKFWRKFTKSVQDNLFSIFIGKGNEKIWFSTYFTEPPINWAGKKLVFVHDCISERYSDEIPNAINSIETKKSSIIPADKIICNSQTTAEDLHEYYPINLSNVTVAHLGYNKIFRKKNDNEIDLHIPYRFLLYVGKRKYYKNFSLLLHAFMKWKENTKIKLVVVGPAWDKYEKEFLTKNYLEKDVVLFSRPDDHILCDLYNQAEAFVYPSKYEGFGIPLLEAMACGCAIVASDIPSTREIAGEIPIYFDPDNPESLKRSLNMILVNEKKIEKIWKGLMILFYFPNHTAVLEVLKELIKLENTN